MGRSPHSGHGAQEVGLLREKARDVCARPLRPRRRRPPPRAGRQVVEQLSRSGQGVRSGSGMVRCCSVRAAGDSGGGMDAKVARILTDRGWRTAATQRRRVGGRRGSGQTLDPLESMAGGQRATPRSSHDWPEPPSSESPTPYEMRSFGSGEARSGAGDLDD